MSQTPLRQLISQGAAAPRERFFDLPLKQQLQVAREIFRLHASLIFSRKFIWFLLGLLAYMVLRYIINYHSDVSERVTQQSVIPALLLLPLVAMAVLTNMFLISAEKENRTLESMFTLAGSRYRIWLLRIAVLQTVLLALSYALAVIAFFTFTDLAIFGTALHVFVPVFFVGNLTLYFSVKLRSALGAGLLTGLMLFVFLVLELIFRNIGQYRYGLFFNPYALPREIDPATWNTWVWQNRIGILILGGAFLYAALRGMDRRERLLQ